MEKLIYTDALIETIRKHSYLMRGEWNESDYAMTVTGIEQAIAEQPEAVVRCENCIHDNDCAIQDIAQTGFNFFCGCAERRTE